MGIRLSCPHCGNALDLWDQPRVTVDALVRNAAGQVLLVRRTRTPAGWALPGGFVDAGESLEEAVARELAEETGLRALRVSQFHTYSDPHRDPRHATVSTVFLVEAEGSPAAGDDAADARFYDPDRLPHPMAFDHADIVGHAAAFLRDGRFPDGLREIVLD
jgi:ADP-ribose pyrophosphatase YjhB (NUDIX family)